MGIRSSRATLGRGIRAAAGIPAERGLPATERLPAAGLSATAAAEVEHQFDDKDVILPEGSYIDDFETAKWRAGSQGKFLVITVATATPAVDDATISKYLKYRNSDTLGALALR